LNDDFSKMTEKPIDMFPRTDSIKNRRQISIPSTRAMWSAWFPSKENTVSKAAYGKGWRVFGKIWACSRGRGEGTPVSI